MLSSKISVNSNETNVTIAGKHHGTTITLVGSSCAASVLPGQRGNSLTFTPEKDHEVVAIHVTWLINHDKQSQTGNFLFAISKDGDKIRIDLETIFTFKPGRVGQILDDIGLVVLIGNEHFLAPSLFNKHYSAESRAEQLKEYRLLANRDANLLCKFIAGHIEADEVTKAATALVEQTVDVPALRKQVEELQAQNKSSTGVINGLGEQHTELEQEITRLNALCSDLREENRDLSQKIGFINHNRRQIVVDLIAKLVSPVEGWWDKKGQKIAEMKRELDSQLAGLKELEK